VNNERPIYITPLLVFATLAFFPAFANAQAHDEVCDVVQASFATLLKSQDPAYPRDIEPSSGSTMLEGICSLSGSITLKGIGCSSTLAKLGLREDEVSDLISQQTKYAKANFLPECDWKGQAIPLGTTSVKFSNPIFSSNSQLAAISVSFVPSWRYGPNTIGGHGHTCVLQKSRFWLACTVLGNLDQLASQTWRPKR
jgi:hypothetical protein